MTQKHDKPVRLDRLDVKILDVLRRDGRITNQRLADTVGLSPSACLERVRRLERCGVIEGYRAVLGPAALGRPVVVFAQVTLEQHGHGGQRQFERHLAELPETLECFEVSGASDYIVRFICPDVEHYQQLTEALLGDPTLGVRQISSHIALRTVLDAAGLPLEMLLEPHIKD